MANKILRFTLQPIVENAIFHGIEPKGCEGIITIHLYSDDKTKIKIDITDNGIGMTPELIQKILLKTNRINLSSSEMWEKQCA